LKLAISAILLKAIKKNNMKKIIVSIIFTFANIAYCGISTVAISPFVDRGFSYSFAFSVFPTKSYDSGRIDSYEESHGIYNTNNNDEFIYYTEKSYKKSLFIEDYFTVGIKERAAITMNTSIVFPPLYNNIQLKIVALKNETKSKLFQNVSITPFLGFLADNAFILVGASDSYIDFYNGVSVGTRHLVSEKVNLELFTSPMIYKSYFTLFCNPSEGGDYGSGEILSLNIPIAIRILFGEIRRFSFKSGVIPVVALKKTLLDISPASFFIESSFHLGRKKGGKK
jgi:hypothetical protein